MALQLGKKQDGSGGGGRAEETRAVYIAGQQLRLRTGRIGPRVLAERLIIGVEKKCNHCNSDQQKDTQL